MSLVRIWMATSVAVVQGHTDQGLKWNSGLKFSKNSQNFRPLAGIISSDSGDFIPYNFGGDRDERKHVEESVQKAMFITCWVRTKISCWKFLVM
ncbi:hypothetical protein MKX01_011574 [Papaver californicum]|nr:hypothetical protein MKX01_011574 [Papaver californicum]